MLGNYSIWILGLLGLNIIVFIHELGHFLVARATGITVEVFSIGMGPKLWKKQFKTFEFAISALPLGGYCKMQGETMQNRNSEPAKKGDLYYGHPWRRLLTVMAGAGFNFIFTYLIFVGMSMMDRHEIRMENRIFVPQEQSETALPFLSGDKIIRINGKSIDYFHQIEQHIIVSGGDTLSFDILRDETAITLTKEIRLDSKTGIGIMPFTPYLSNTLQYIYPDSPAEKHGLLAGDTLMAINGERVNDFHDISRILRPYQADEVIELTVLKANHSEPTTLSIPLSNGKLGISVVQEVAVSGDSLFLALGSGAKLFVTTLRDYIRGLHRLITGQLEFKSSLSGPIQTTEIIGEVARSSIKEGSVSIFYLLAILSIIIGFMNLLPIPLLDGGLIVLFLLEMILGNKPLPNGVLKAYQIIGFTIIFGLLALSINSDILHIFNKK